MADMTPADIAAINNGGWGGDNSFFWVFALLLLGNGGLGGWGNGNGNSNAIQADVNRGFDNQNLQAQTRDILSAVTNGTAQTIAASTANASNAITAIKDGNAALIREFGNVETALTALGGQSAQCCCDIKQLVQATSANTDAQIAAAKYETAMQLAGIESRLAAKMDANEITNLRDQVQQLQLAQATSGMLKFPNSWSYGAGPFPPIFGGCCGNGNI